MIVAAQPGPSVGVSPGTTTFQLAGPEAGVTCDRDERGAYQQMRERPPWRRRVAAAGQRVRQVMDPYSTLESLKGVLGNPTREIVSAGKSRASRWPDKPSRVNDFRDDETRDYGFQYTDHSPYGFGRPGVGTPGVPNDRQLSTIYGYTPWISGQIPFQQGAWAPAPWAPPYGGRPAYVEAGIQAANRGLGDAAADAGVVTAPDMPTATLQTLQLHQDRMYLLGIISAAAVASTALVNVFRYASERRDTRKRTKVAAEPSPSISGWRRQRRRRR